MKGLITDRGQENILRRNALAAKGRAGMTEEELSEWLGDPMATTGANLFAPGPYHSSAVELKYRNRSIVVTAISDGANLYAVSIIGKAAKYAGKTFTLSIEAIASSDGGNPQIALYWYDGNGFEFAGATLAEAGSVTFTVTPNTNDRAYLAAYIYVTNGEAVTAGAIARFYGVMLEIGSERHEYVPYAEVVATQATKGAYNYSDLNRVERTAAELSDELYLDLVTKTDWNMWDIPRVSDMERYLNNIKEIRRTQAIDVALPGNMSGLNYSSANNIEKILSNAYETVESFARCGEIFCGEV